MGEETGLNRLSAAVDPVGSSPMRAMEAPNELWEWLRLLNRRKALIVGCGLVAVALMALIIAQATPMYKASARIMLDTRTFKVVSTEAALSGVDTMNLGAIQSELEVIQSEFLIGRVVDGWDSPTIRSSTAPSRRASSTARSRRSASCGTPASPRCWRRRPSRADASRSRRAAQPPRRGQRSRPSRRDRRRRRAISASRCSAAPSSS